jgi:hypothetical protein
VPNISKNWVLHPATEKQISRVLDVLIERGIIATSKQLRKVTYKSLAEDMGVAPQTLYNLFHGKYGYVRDENGVIEYKQLPYRASPFILSQFQRVLGIQLGAPQELPKMSGRVPNRIKRGAQGE